MLRTCEWELAVGVCWEVRVVAFVNCHRNCLTYNSYRIEWVRQSRSELSFSFSFRFPFSFCFGAAGVCAVRDIYAIGFVKCNG